MSYIQTSAIITAIREVVESGYGSLRTITDGTYTGDWPAGLSESEQKRRALEGPRTRVNLNVTGRSPNSPPINGNLVIYDASVTITIERIMARSAQLTQTEYDAVQAAAALDTDVVRQAVEYPGNLTLTSAGAPTDIVSGMLRWQSSATNVVGLVNDGAQRVETVHNFTACLISRPATRRVVEFSASGTWDVPSGVTSATVYVWGGGGGGGAAATYGGGGGGGGGFSSGTTPTTPGETITVTIGAGGAAGVSGGSSTVTALSGSLTSGGGAHGVNGTIAGQGAGGAGGSTSFGGYVGGAGGGGGGSVAYGAGGGGSAGIGGAGGAGAAVGTYGTAGAGGSGTGIYPGARGGQGAAGSTAAVAGAVPGGGGGGASTGAAAAAGAAGYVVILY